MVTDEDSVITEIQFIPKHNREGVAAFLWGNTFPPPDWLAYNYKTKNQSSKKILLHFQGFIFIVDLGNFTAHIKFPAPYH